MPGRNTGYDAPFFDAEKREIMEAAGRGEYLPDDRPLSEVTAQWQVAAMDARATGTTTFRIAEPDATRLRAVAARRGVTPQALLRSAIGALLTE